MSTITSTRSARSGHRRRRTAVLLARWLVSFAGFPLGGLATMLVIGPIDRPVAAVAGGALTGSVLGAGQAWALGFGRRAGLSWLVLTGAGLAAGLPVAAASLGYPVALPGLAAQGLITGAVVGLGQALLLRRMIGNLALGWPLWLALSWALGWTVTTAIGVDVARQFSVFGSAGAVTVTVLTAVLPLAIRRFGPTSSAV